MGGYIGQILGANYSRLVTTLTLISTTADHRPYMDATMSNCSNEYELPYPSQKFIKYIKMSKNNPPKNDEEFRSNQIEGWKMFFGGKLNEEDLHELVRLINLSSKRNKNKFASFNHGLAVVNSNNRLELIKKIKAPTLIIHGTDDVCFSSEHAILLNKSISNSKLKIIEGMGHMFAFSQADSISNEIFNFINQ
jgi:pimeloyl-ACP methyl ester carboxylesterase